MTELLYHVTTLDEWEAHEEVYEPEAFLVDGFVHCCSMTQLGAVLGRHFSGREGLLLLEIDAGEIESEIRWEYAHATNDLFPHVFGPIAKRAVRSVMPIEPEVEVRAADIASMDTTTADLLRTHIDE